MNHTEATQYIKATLGAFVPSESISMTQDTWSKLHEAMTVLIAQPAEQEPVAWGLPRPDGLILDVICPEEHDREPGQYTVPLYAAPQPVKREPLTRDQVKAMLAEAGYKGAAAQHRADFINGLRHGERAHGIGEQP